MEKFMNFSSSRQTEQELTADTKAPSPMFSSKCEATAEKIRTKKRAYEEDGLKCM